MDNDQPTDSLGHGSPNWGEYPFDEATEREGKGPDWDWTVYEGPSAHWYVIDGRATRIAIVRPDLPQERQERIVKLMAMAPQMREALQAIVDKAGDLEEAQSMAQEMLDFMGGVMTDAHLQSQRDVPPKSTILLDTSAARWNDIKIEAENKTPQFAFVEVHERGDTLRLTVTAQPPKMSDATVERVVDLLRRQEHKHRRDGFGPLSWSDDKIRAALEGSEEGQTDGS